MLRLHPLLFMCIFAVGFVPLNMKISWAADVLRIGVTENVYDRLNTMPNRAQPEATEIEFERPAFSQEVADVLHLQDALRHAGYTGKFEILPLESTRDILFGIRNGELDLSGIRFWVSAFEDIDGLTSSTPTTETLEVGLFTRPDHPILMERTNPELIQTLAAVSNRTWQQEWQALEDIGVDDMTNVETWFSMIRLVSTNRVDFLLVPFQDTPDLTVRAMNFPLTPIPRIKIRLVGERAYVLATPEGTENALQHLINSGLESLTPAQSSHEMRNLPDRVKAWQVLN